MSTFQYQFSSGSATAATDLGNVIVAVRNDAVAGINPTNLAYGFYSVDASGRMWVTGTLGVSASNLTANVTQGTTPWIVSGNVSATQVTNPWVVSASNIVSISGNVSAHAVTAAQSGTWNINNIATVSAATASQNGVVWGVTASAVTASIASGTITLASGSIAAITATAGTPAGVTVSTATGASTVVLKAVNAARKAIIITNAGVGDLYVGHTTAVTTGGATMGLIVSPRGAYMDSGFGLYTGDLYGVYSIVSTTQNVSVSERS